MEYLKNYGFQQSYHPGKLNVVGDALSRKRKLDKDHHVALLWAMSTKVIVINPMWQVTSFLVNLVISKDLVEQVKLAQMDDAILAKFIQSSTDISMDSVGVAKLRGRLFVPK